MKQTLVMLSSVAALIAGRGASAGGEQQQLLSAAPAGTTPAKASPVSFFVPPTGYASFQDYCDKVLTKGDDAITKAFDDAYAEASKSPGFLKAPFEVAGSALCTPGCQVRPRALA